MSFPEATDQARKDLSEIRNGIQDTLHEVEAGPERAVLHDVLDFIDDAAAHRELLGKNPERSFEACLALLSDADRRLFMIRNVLESLKRQEDPRVTLKHYQSLGLLSKKESMPPPTPTTMTEVQAFQGRTARAALWAEKQLKRAVAVISGLTIEAARAIPKLAKVKMGVTFVGGIPCPSFQLEAGSADWEVGELWARIKSSYENARV
jgi:hypothetical protein